MTTPLLRAGLMLALLMSVLDLSLAYVQSLNGNVWIASAPGYKMNAVVPGSMYMDMLTAGVISDPYKRYNDINYAKYADMDWEYTRRFEVSKELMGYSSIDLVCDGIDTVSELYVNGKKIGKTTDQFIQYRLSIKDFIKLGINDLRIQFMSAVNYAASQSNASAYVVPPQCPPPVQHGQCHPNFIRKEQASFSWDWGPSYPTQGIWKDIRLEAYNNVTLTDFSAEIRQSAETSQWLVDIVGYLSGMQTLSTPSSYLFVAVLQGTGINKTANIIINNQSADSINMSLTIDSDKVKQWWPNGYGAQVLYNLSVSLSQTEPKWLTKRIGFKTIELVQEPIKGAKGLSFYFKVNGQAIFMKGSNWVPADSFQSRITKDKLRDHLTSAKLAHMNMLRVWGGGVYERNDFYDLTDEMGIIIWQDLMFACAMYPTGSDFLANVTLEVTQQVRRLKHHASLGLWAGNNENEAALRDNWYNTTSKFDMYKSDYIKLYIDTVKVAVNREHPTGIFLSSSPSNAAESEQEGWIAQNPYDTKYGDVHYYNYTAGRYYVDDHPRSRFLSEYGMQSWPSVSSLLPLTLTEDLHEFSDFAAYRNHHATGQNQINDEIRYYFHTPNSSLGDPATNFSHYVYLTQVNQAMYIKMVSEFCRRSQSFLYGDEGMTMGALYWQLNDIWPGPSWSSIEYSGKWKMLHYYAKRFFAPRMLSMSMESGNLTIYLVQDVPDVSPHSLTLSCYSWSSYLPKKSVDIAVKLKHQVSNLLFNQDLQQVLKQLNCTSRQNYFLYAYWDEFAVADMPLSTYKTAVGLKKANITFFLAGSYPTVTMIVSTDTVAPFVWFDSHLDGVLFEDNGFLLVDYTKVVLVTLTHNVTLTTKDITVMSLMDLYA